MRSNIVFLIVFMLSFVTVHDMVFAVIDQNKKINVTSSKQISLVSKQSIDIHQIHHLCHYVAVVSTEIPLISVDYQSQTIVYHTIEHLLPHKKSLIKPPIA